MLYIEDIVNCTIAVKHQNNSHSLYMYTFDHYCVSNSTSEAKIPPKMIGPYKNAWIMSTIHPLDFFLWRQNWAV